MLRKKNAWNWVWRGVIFASPTVVIILIRLAGWLQPLEWSALDIYFQLRPVEPPDKRILIVGVEESDIQKLGRWPTSDRVLASLLTKIKLQQPRAIGLDIYRDVPVPPGHEELIKVFKSTPNLVGVQKVLGDNSSKISPPPVLRQLNQVSSVDLVVDGDGVVRRGILFPISDGKQSIQSLGLAVALLYLKEQGITPKANEKGSLELGKTVFVPFEENDGGYVRTDAYSYQMLLNFRGKAQSFLKVSLTDVLEGRIKPDLMRDHIVLIGAQTPSLNDLFYTPYSKELVTTPERTPGVEIQANIASQVLSSVLDNRPFIKVWDETLEALWIILCPSIIIILGLKWQASKTKPNFSLMFLLKTIVAVFLLTLGLIGSSYLAFLIGWWIPVVSPLLALYSETITIAGYIYISNLKESNQQLLDALLEVRESKLEIENYSYSLEQQAQVLQESESRLKLALEAAEMGIWEWNVATDRITVSKKYEQLFGLEPGTFEGTRSAFLESVHPEERESVTQAIIRSLSGGLDYNREFRIIWPSGEPHWIETIGKVFYDKTGKATRMLGTFRDVTQRKQGEQASFQVEAKWSSLTHNSSDIITVISDDLIIQYSSYSCQRILGYCRRELISKNILDFIHPKDIPTILDSITEICQHPAKILQIEYRHRHQDGSWRFIESVLWNRLCAPAIEGIIINSSDITERKNLELLLGLESF